MNRIPPWEADWFPSSAELGCDGSCVVAALLNPCPCGFAHPVLQCVHFFWGVNVCNPAITSFLQTYVVHSSLTSWNNPSGISASILETKATDDLHDIIIEPVFPFANNDIIQTSFPKALQPAHAGSCSLQTQVLWEHSRQRGRLEVHFHFHFIH